MVSMTWSMVLARKARNRFFSSGSEPLPGLRALRTSATSASRAYGPP